MLLPLRARTGMRLIARHNGDQRVSWRRISDRVARQADCLLLTAKDVDSFVLVAKEARYDRNNREVSDLGSTHLVV